MPVPKRLKTVVDTALKDGWVYDETQDGHPRLTPPPGWLHPGTGTPAPPVTFGKTPSDRRGDLNAEALLRRLGVNVPRKKQTKKENR